MLSGMPVHTVTACSVPHFAPPVQQSFGHPHFYQSQLSFASTLFSLQPSRRTGTMPGWFFLAQMQMWKCVYETERWALKKINKLSSFFQYSFQFCVVFTINMVGNNLSLFRFQTTIQAYFPILITKAACFFVVVVWFALLHFTEVKFVPKRSFFNVAVTS